MRNPHIQRPIPGSVTRQGTGNTRHEGIPRWWSRRVEEGKLKQPSASAGPHAVAAAPPKAAAGPMGTSVSASSPASPAAMQVGGAPAPAAPPAAASPGRMRPLARWLAARRQAREATAAYRLKEGYPGIRVWNAIRRPFVTGDGFKALSYAAAVGATAAPIASMFVRDANMQQHLLEAGAGLGASVAGLRVMSDLRSSDFSTRGMRFLKDAATNAPFAEKAERDLVRRFAQDPKGTMKLYKTDPLGIAAVYSILHKRRKSPNGGYNMSVHEDSRKFKGLLEPLLKYHALGKPYFRDGQIHEITRRHGFAVTPRFLTTLRTLQTERPDEAARRIALPRDIAGLLPTCLEQASPSSLRELEDIVLFSGAVIRAKQNKFGKNGVNGSAA